MRLRDVLVCCVMALVANCAAYKILVVFPFPAGSHRIIGGGVVRHLLEAGHEVAYVTPFVRNNTHNNLRQIYVTDNLNAFDGSYVNIEALMKKETYFDPDTIFNVMIKITKRTLENENVLNLLNDPNERFDLVISQWMFNEVPSGIAAVYNCPHIWVVLHEHTSAVLSLIDEALNPAYVASVELNFIPPLNFWQRLKSLHFQVHCMLRYYLMYRSIEKEIFDKTFGPILKKRNQILPSYEEVRLNTSLIFGNYHVSLGQSIRLPQNYIPIGGQHIEDDVVPLPQDLKKIMDESKHGVIYFSMGSNLKSKELPDSIKLSILKMFSGLKQTVIWKFEDTLPNVPENVHLLHWAPQQSILSHPNCVLFISHGGLLSTMEAVHFGVPLLGIPVYFDQELNVEKAALNGIALKVELTERIAAPLKSAIHEMLSNSKYRERMKEVSFIFHHRPVKPGKELVHWVEHVIRTGGAIHLRSPALLMPWYQKIYLDLTLLVLTIMVVMIYCIKACLIKLKIKASLSLHRNQRKTKRS